MTQKQIKRHKKNQEQESNKNRLIEDQNVQKDSEIQPLNHEHERLIQWFKTIKFKKVVFGGVDEAALWKRLEELNHIYKAALSAERARYDALFKAHTKASNLLIRQYKQKLEKYEKGGEDTIWPKSQDDAWKQTQERETDHGD